MYKLPLLLLLSLFALSSYGQALYISHCVAACPSGSANSNDLVVRNLYAASVNRDSQLADWVAYRVLADTIGVASLLPREWHSDGLLEAGLKVEDLDNSRRSRAIANGSENPDENSYRIAQSLIDVQDRGRLVPMSSFAGTSYWEDMNSLTNMGGMKQDMRLGPWARLDQAVNSLAQQHGELFVISGPLYEIGTSISRLNSADQALQSHQAVAFFKLIASAQGQVSVFIFSQQLQQHKPFCTSLSNLNELEQRSSLDLFPRQTQWPIGNLDAALGC